MKSGKVSTFLYEFAHRPSYSPLDEWVVANHGQEVPFVIGEPFLRRLPDVWKDEERQLSATVMVYWSNFAKTGSVASL